MGLFQRWIYGVDLDEEQARQNDLDKKLAEENKRDLSAGVIDRATFDIAEAQRNESYIGDVSGEVSTAFDEGFKEGVDNVRGTIGSAISLPFSLIPWQLWIVLGVVALVYTGGWTRLAGILKKP